MRTDPVGDRRHAVEGSKFAVTSRTVSQQIQDRNPGWPRTLHGPAHVEDPTPDDDSWEPKFVPIGARVGRSGQVFETDGRAGLGGLVVKLFTWAAGLPAQVVQDFTREAMRVADLHHPHVAQVLDAGTLGDGTPFVVMERLAGMTLDEAVSGRSLPIAEVLPILRGVGSALSAAHAAGVAHGQLRADNVFIADLAAHGSACPKLLDFGVARLVAGAHEIGRGGHALGHRAAERADQLALATLAWRLLGSMPAPVQRVLLRAMSPDPSQRFGSVAALVEALEEASVSARPRDWLRRRGREDARRRIFPVSPSRLAPAIVVAPPSGLAAAPPSAGRADTGACERAVLADAAVLRRRRAARDGARGRPDERRGVSRRSRRRGRARDRSRRARATQPRTDDRSGVARSRIGGPHRVDGRVARQQAGGRSGALQMPHPLPFSLVRSRSHQPERCARLGLPTEVREERRSRSVGHHPCSRPPFAAPARPSVTASEAPAPPRSAVPADTGPASVGGITERGDRRYACSPPPLRLASRFPAQRPSNGTTMRCSLGRKPGTSRVARRRRRTRLARPHSRPPRQTKCRRRLPLQRRPRRRRPPRPLRLNGRRRCRRSIASCRNRELSDQAGVCSGYHPHDVDPRSAVRPRFSNPIPAAPQESGRRLERFVLRLPATTEHDLHGRQPAACAAREGGMKIYN